DKCKDGNHVHQKVRIGIPAIKEHPDLPVPWISGQTFDSMRTPVELDQGPMPPGDPVSRASIDALDPPAVKNRWKTAPGRAPRPVTDVFVCMARDRYRWPETATERPDQ